MEVALVAITRFATSVEDEARALASELGGVAYDHRRKLAAGVPAIVMSTPDGEAARGCARRVSARGHDVFVCSSADVVPASEMVDARRFTFDADALVSHDALGDRFAWSDITALIRATHRTSTETTSSVTEQKFAPMRAVMTGGLIMNKSTTTTQTSRAADLEPVLYMFGERGRAPWLLREHHARYEALGSATTPHSLKNFELAVAEIRRRASRARFDDRLATRKGVTPEEVDVLAHVIARTPAR